MPIRLTYDRSTPTQSGDFLAENGLGPSDLTETERHDAAKQCIEFLTSDDHDRIFVLEIKDFIIDIDGGVDVVGHFLNYFR